MNFGERIYELRNKKGMSQGELADRLDVSRQAVSKWENNSAVPELDKLLRMSEIFAVSLDELVKGETVKENVKETENTVTEVPVPVIIKQAYPMRKIAALILFGMAFVTAVVLFTMGGFPAMLYGVPFVCSGLICYYSEKHPGIKCLWFVYYLLGIIFLLTTGAFAYDALFTGEWDDSVIFTLGLIAVHIFMIVFTSVKLKDDPIKNKKKAKRNLILLWCLVAAAVVGSIIVNYLYTVLIVRTPESVAPVAALSDFIYIFNAVYDFVKVTLIASAISFTVRYKKQKS